MTTEIKDKSLEEKPKKAEEKPKIVIEIPDKLTAFLDGKNWENNEDKNKAIRTLEDIDRTETSFGGMQVKDRGICVQVIGPMPRIEVRAIASKKREQELQRTKELSRESEENKEENNFERKPGELKVLTKGELTLFFNTACEQLFEGSDLNENEQANYRNFLSRYLHQGAIYHQGAKYVLHQLLYPQDLAMSVKDYNAHLFFKGKVLYLSDEVVTTQIISMTSGEAQEGDIKMEALLRIELKEERKAVVAKITAEEFTVGYSPELRAVFEPKKSDRASLVNRFTSLWSGKKAGRAESPTDGNQFSP
jgi:hypothetical protein